MTNVHCPDISDYRDIESLNAWTAAKQAGTDLPKLLKGIQQQGRDNVRTPMQWDASPNAGFTTAAEPWIKVNPNYPEINAAKALADKHSIYYFYQQLLKLRKQHPTLIYGAYEMIDGNHAQLYAYRRWDAAGEYYVFLNFGEEPLALLGAPDDLSAAQLCLSNYTSVGDTLLRPWEGRIYQRP